MLNLPGLFLKEVLRTGKALQAFPGLEVDVTSLGTRPEGPCGLWAVKSLPPRGQLCWRESEYSWASGSFL